MNREARKLVEEIEDLHQQVFRRGGRINEAWVEWYAKHYGAPEAEEEYDRVRSAAFELLMALRDFEAAVRW